MMKFPALEIDPRKVWDELNNQYSTRMIALLEIFITFDIYSIYIYNLAGLLDNDVTRVFMVEEMDAIQPIDSSVRGRPDGVINKTGSKTFKYFSLNSENRVHFNIENQLHVYSIVFAKRKSFIFKRVPKKSCAEKVSIEQ